MRDCQVQLPRKLRGELQLIPEPEAVKLAAFAKALSDPIRLNMLRLLEQMPDLCTCEFEDLLGLSQSKVSYHLKVLLDAGLISRRTYGTWSHYSLSRSGTLEALEQLCHTP